MADDPAVDLHGVRVVDDMTSHALATTARLAQTRYKVVCDEYTTPLYQTRAEAEAHLAAIIDHDACRLEHRIVPVAPSHRPTTKEDR